jgi:Family of unknown function (DUF5677)
MVTTKGSRTRQAAKPAYRAIDEFIEELVAEEIAAGRMHPDEVEARVTKAIRIAGPRYTRALARRLRRGAPEHLRALERDRHRFERHIRRTWGGAIDRLELLSSVFREFGDQLFREGVIDNRLKHPTFRALADLHARACRLSGEITSLLRSGYADGANARWRTLHEVAVVSTLLSDNNRDLSLRYLHHYYIKAWKAAEDYQLHHASLGGTPMPERRLTSLRRQRDTLCQRFGKYYETDWGWAASVIPDNGRAPSFPRIEAACSLQSVRPLVANANDAVHGGPRGLQPTGVHLHGHGFLLAGGSDAGLADPGANAAIALARIALARVSFAPSIEHGLTVHTIMLLKDDCVAAFDRARDKVLKLTIENLARQGLHRRKQLRKRNQSR